MADDDAPSALHSLPYNMRLMGDGRVYGDRKFPGAIVCGAVLLKGDMKLLKVLVSDVIVYDRSDRA